MEFLNSRFKYSKLAFLLCCILLPLTSPAQVFKENKAVISGSVKDFVKEKHQNTVVFLINSVVNGITKKTEILDSTGSFRLETVIANPLDISVQYANHTTELFLRPGDSLKIELTGLPVIHIIGGNLARENRMIQDFLAKRTTPDYKKPMGASPLFDTWVADYINYEVWSKQIRRYNQQPLSGDSISLLLRSYKMNDLPVVSAPYTEFLAGLYRFFTHKVDPDKSELFARYAEERNFLGLGGIFAESIKNKTTGLTRDLLLTSFFMDALDGQQLNEFKALWNKTPIVNPYLKSKVLAKSEELEAYLKNQQIKAHTLAEVLPASEGSVLDTVAKRFPGKVIYIDFWAPWCSPCMAAMPASKEMQQYYKNKDIVFVFFASQCSDESWKSTIANKELTGTHYKLTNDQFNVLSSKFNINGIPHYVILDKQGKLANGNAPGPEQNKGLKQELDRLLK